MKKALIVYGTRYGATANTSEEITKVFREEKYETQVVVAKKHKVQDLSEFDLVIIGSGMQIEMWTFAATRFLKKFQKDLARKKIAIFVSSGAEAILKSQNRLEEITRMRKKYLEDIFIKFNLHPLAFEMFGGIWDFNRLPWWSKKAMVNTKHDLEVAGFREVNPGIYDTRDKDAIRDWAMMVARKAATSF